MKGARKRNWDDKPEKSLVSRIHKQLRRTTRNALRTGEEPPIEKSSGRYGQQRSRNNK